MQRTLPFTLWEITKVERGAVASVVVKPITVTHIDDINPDLIQFIDADGAKCWGHYSDYYDNEAAAIADLEGY